MKQKILKAVAENIRKQGAIVVYSEKSRLDLKLLSNKNILRNPREKTASEHRRNKKEKTLKIRL